MNSNSQGLGVSTWANVTGPSSAGGMLRRDVFERCLDEGWSDADAREAQRAADLLRGPLTLEEQFGFSALQVAEGAALDAIARGFGLARRAGVPSQLLAGTCVPAWSETDAELRARVVGLLSASSLFGQAAAVAPSWASCEVPREQLEGLLFK